MSPIVIIAVSKASIFQSTSINSHPEAIMCTDPEGQVFISIYEHIDTPGYIYTVTHAFILSLV